jgi:hypothetical protein
LNWLASLSGNSIVLNNLEMMSSSHFVVFDDSDDHESENYFVRSNHFVGIDDSEQIYSAMSGLIQLINGASAINLGFDNYICRGNIKLDRLYYSKFPSISDSDSDSDWTNVKLPEDISPSNPFIGVGGSSCLSNPFNSPTTGYIELCLEHEDIFNILRQISFGFDWRNLYCIWDTVCYYSGGQKKIIKDLGLNQSRIKAFTGTANNFGVLGLEARHGVMGWQIPKNIVSHEEAVNIVNEVVAKYLKNKICFGCEFKKWDSQFRKSIQLTANTSTD